MFEVVIQAADRRQDHRARDRQGAAQERHRQVLRRRHHPQAQAPREAEGRQEAHEAGRARRDPAGGVPRRAQGWRVRHPVVYDRAAMAELEARRRDVAAAAPAAVPKRKSQRPRVRRGARRRAAAGARHPHLRRPGLQDPVRLDAADAPDRRPHPGQQVPLRPASRGPADADVARAAPGHPEAEARATSSSSSTRRTAPRTSSSA